MFLFAHTGITLGLGLIVEKAVNYRRARATTLAPAYAGASGGCELAGGQSECVQPPVKPALAALRLDYRVILIGSVLPDIIDKPLWLLARDAPVASRAFAHTLLFLLLLAFVALYFWRRRGAIRPLTLLASTLVHFILDAMWQTPGTLLWPLLGWSLEVSHYTLQDSFLSMVNNPPELTAEIFGLLILLAFGVAVLHRHGVRQFLRAGRGLDVRPAP